ncbi:MAG: AAA family ATPase, partial [Oribacterium sinus]|nr:AAA family ATPase [Oribacterium sinus]
AYKNNSSLMGRKREMEELKESIEKGKEACNTIRKAVEEKVKACNRLEQELSTKEEERHQQEKGISELELMLQAKMQLEYQTLSTKTDFLTEQMHGYSDALEKLFAEKFDLEEAEKQSKESVLHQEEEILKLQEKLSDGEKAFSDRKESLQSIQEQKQKIAEKQKAYFAEKEKFAEAQLNQEKEALRLENQKEKLEEQSAKSAQYILEEYGLKFSEVKQYYREELCEDPALSKEIQEMKGNIRSLGPINLDSIQQFEEVSERYSFLHQQVEDLLASEKSLQEIIADLDRGMRKQFHENFSKIQVEFNKVFRVLFGGGQGRLEMEEGEDVLESGIRIVAEPPGKKLQNMMQLSGGEKALTAISLLFALQSLKPSPFCLLDEIEAALDDSNVVRFAEYLYHLIKNTQFIVITHRRGTMERADRLFGVTMQEKGISTLVSVDLVEDQLQ